MVNTSHCPVKQPSTLTLSSGSQIDGNCLGEASQYENPRFIAEMVLGDAIAPTRSLITLILEIL